MLKILIAEDDLMIGDSAEEALAGSGYEVCGIARTVDEAVALGRRHRPDVVIIDMRLADGGSGTEIPAQLSDLGRFGVLYATGNSAKVMLSAADGDACLSKPYTGTALVRAVEIVAGIVASGTASIPFPPGFQVLTASGTARLTIEQSVATMEESAVKMDESAAKMDESAVKMDESALKMEESAADLRNLLRQQAAVAGFGSFALRQRDITSILTEGARVCAEVLAVPFSKVCRYRPDENDLLIEAGNGLAPGVVGHLAFAADATSPVGRAFVTGEPSICKNLHEHNFDLPPFYAVQGIVSTIAVVIRGDERAYGVLEIGSDVQRDFDPHDVEFLTGFANTLAEAVATSAVTAVLQSSIARMEHLVEEKDRVLGQKNVLAEELQHRVRNNLQLVTAMVGKLLSDTADPAGQRRIKSVERRVCSLARVYDQLLGGEMTRTMDFAVYVKSLCLTLEELQGSPSSAITLSCESEQIILDLDTVTTLGLVVTELVGNSYEHAFPNGIGAVSISIFRDAGNSGSATMIIRDSGTGFTPQVESKRHGLGLVRRLVEQIRGTVSLDSDQKTVWTIQFPTTMETAQAA